jgi:hypothetical protein
MFQLHWCDTRTIMRPELVLEWSQINLVYIASWFAYSHDQNPACLLPNSDYFNTPACSKGTSWWLRRVMLYICKQGMMLSLTYISPSSFWNGICCHLLLPKLCWEHDLVWTCAQGHLKFWRQPMKVALKRLCWTPQSGALPAPELTNFPNYIVHYLLSM